MNFSIFFRILIVIEVLINNQFYLCQDQSKKILFDGINEEYWVNVGRNNSRGTNSKATKYDLIRVEDDNKELVINQDIKLLSKIIEPKINEATSKIEFNIKGTIEINPSRNENTLVKINYGPIELVFFHSNDSKNCIDVYFSRSLDPINPQYLLINKIPNDPGEPFHFNLNIPFEKISNNNAKLNQPDDILKAFIFVNNNGTKQEPYLRRSYLGSYVLNDGIFSELDKTFNAFGYTRDPFEIKKFKDTLEVETKLNGTLKLSKLDITTFSNELEIIDRKIDISTIKNDNKYALIIGSDIYEKDNKDSRGLKNLIGVKEDYRKMREKLNWLHYEIDEIPPNNAVTKQMVLERIKLFEEKLENEKRKNKSIKVVVYYAGHGYLNTDIKSTQDFALFGDFETEVGTGKYDMLNQNDFLGIMDKCEEFLLIADACRESKANLITRGGKLIQGTNTSDKSKNERRKSYIILASRDQGSTTDDSNSSLTHYLCEQMEYDISFKKMAKNLQERGREIRIQKFGWVSITPDDEDIINPLDNLYFHKFSNQ
jgi:hypothetical protein